MSFHMSVCFRFELTNDGHHRRHLPIREVDVCTFEHLKLGQAYGRPLANVCKWAMGPNCGLEIHFPVPAAEEDNHAKYTRKPIYFKSLFTL
jgi:hypothetical protein